MKYILILSSVFALLVSSVSCSSGGSKSVVSQWLSDGQSRYCQLQKGTYEFSITASGDGVDAQWLGGTCATQHITAPVTVICEFHQAGQLIISNPTTFGLGESVSFTATIKKK